MVKSPGKAHSYCFHISWKYFNNINKQISYGTVIWFIFVLKIISVFNFGGDLISFL